MAIFPNLVRIGILVLIVSSLTTLNVQAKNVLLIVSDDLRASALGCYGDKITRTPHLDRLASSGLVFDKAYCQATWCAPSRNSFMRSRYHDSENRTLGETLQASAITTARVGKIFHMRVPGDIIAGTDGLDVPECWTERFNSKGQEAHSPGEYACLNLNEFSNDLADRQSTKMPHRPYVTVKIDDEGQRQPDYQTAEQAIRWMHRHRCQPFFLAVGFVRPHYPMVAPKRMFDHYPFQQMRLPPVQTDDLADIPKLGLSGSRSDRNGLSRFPDNQRRMWSGYRASVEFMDAQVGRVLASLQDLGLNQETMVIFTSDHGYHLGDHTFWQKSNLHEQVARVPLIIRSPETNPARTDSLVELVDLYPTICHWLDVESPSSCQGEDLTPIFTYPDDQVRDAAITIGGKGNPNYLLRDKRWAYMRYADGSTELYDMENDPDQFNNLAKRENFSEQLQILNERLNQRINQLSEPNLAVGSN